eukprot:scaffold8311_cov63-Cyclotella_meneghiniana.AAC.3
MPDPELVRRVNSLFTICFRVPSQDTLGIDAAEYRAFIFNAVSTASGGGDGRILRYVPPCTRASPFVIAECSSIQTVLELLFMQSLSLPVTDGQDPVRVLFFPSEQSPFTSVIRPMVTEWHAKSEFAREEASSLRSDLQESNQSREVLQREIADMTAQVHALSLDRSSKEDEVTLLQSQLVEVKSSYEKVLSQLAEEKSSHEKAVKSREELQLQLAEMAQLESTRLSYPVLMMQGESIRKIWLNLRGS